MATAGARYTTVTSEKWEDDWYLGMTPQQRNLYDFLEQGSHGTFAGVFKLSPITARAKTQPWRSGAFERTLDEAFVGHVHHYPGNWWFVRSYLKWNGPRSGNLSQKQAEGIVNTLRHAPAECRADWWREYGERLEAHGYSSDSLSIPIETLSKQPSHTIPYHPIPITSCRSRSKPKLTSEQAQVKQAAIDYFYQRLQKHTGLDKPRFPGGQAAKFFTDCILDEYAGDDFREVTDWFFDERIKGDFSSANFSHYQASFNAGCIAVQKRREGAK